MSWVWLTNIEAKTISVTCVVWSDALFCSDMLTLAKLQSVIIYPIVLADLYSDEIKKYAEQAIAVDVQLEDTLPGKPPKGLLWHLLAIFFLCAKRSCFYYYFFILLFSELHWWDLRSETARPCPKYVLGLIRRGFCMLIKSPDGCTVISYTQSWHCIISSHVHVYQASYYLIVEYDRYLAFLYLAFTKFPTLVF